MKVKQIHKNIGVSIEGIDLSRIDNNRFSANQRFMVKTFNYNLSKPKYF